MTQTEILNSVYNEAERRPIKNNRKPTTKKLSKKYYLRLLKNPAKFIENYVENLKRDKTVKFEHKDVWNKIVAGIIRSLGFSGEEVIG